MTAAEASTLRVGERVVVAGAWPCFYGAVVVCRRGADITVAYAHGSGTTAYRPSAVKPHEVARVPA